MKLRLALVCLSLVFCQSFLFSSAFAEELTPEQVNLLENLVQNKKVPDEIHLLSNLALTAHRRARSISSPDLKSRFQTFCSEAFLAAEKGRSVKSSDTAAFRPIQGTLQDLKDRFIDLSNELEINKKDQKEIRSARPKPHQAVHDLNRASSHLVDATHAPSICPPPAADLKTGAEPSVEAADVKTVVETVSESKGHEVQPRNPFLTPLGYFYALGTYFHEGYRGLSQDRGVPTAQAAIDKVKNGDTEIHFRIECPDPQRVEMPQGLNEDGRRKFWADYEKRSEDWKRQCENHYRTEGSALLGDSTAQQNVTSLWLDDSSGGNSLSSGLDGLEKFKNLKHLAITRVFPNRQFFHIRAGDAFKSGTQLESIRIDGVDFGKQGLGGSSDENLEVLLRGKPHLKGLRITEAYVFDEEMEAIARGLSENRELTDLYFRHHVHLTGEKGLSEIFANNKNLRRIMIGGSKYSQPENSFSTAGLEKIVAALKDHTELEYLSLPISVDREPAKTLLNSLKAKNPGLTVVEEYD